MTALIVLASGASSRFGDGNKLLAALNGQPVLQHAINIAAPIGFAARYAVYADSRVRALLEPAGFSCVHNPRPEDGQGVSLSLGAEAALADGHESALIMLGDMPFIELNHLAALMETDGEIIMSEYEGTRLPPSVFRGQAFNTLSGHSGAQGGKSTINLANVTTIPLSQSAARDIDTREDLDKAT